jgi:hypothetical protein
MRIAVLVLSVVTIISQVARGADIKATYEFENTFSSNESSPPDAVAIDPVGSSSFSTGTVLGQSKTVWNFVGNALPNTQQAGLTINTTGLITPESYSVDMVLQLTQREGAWRRLMDVRNRQSDSGFYVDPTNNLNIFPISGSSAAWSNNVYHHVVLTDDGAQVAVYLDGISQFTATTTSMNLDDDPTDNPSKLLGFFVDNIAAGGQGEYSSGSVALIRLWDGVLSPEDAQELATNPFVPEPAMIGFAPALLLLLRRRRQRFGSCCVRQ